ncbi:MAG: endonuclease Q family protein [Candidatus Pacearchaeota archaeon]
MEIIADLHIHSKYSRATSYNLTFDNLEKWAKIKGLNLLGTGDFQHPLWRKEIAEKLVEDDKGILRSKTGFPFVWQTEISLMFSDGKRRRAIHLVVLSPNGKTSDKIIAFLGSRGRLDYDGRPIFGIKPEELVRELKNIDDKIEIIPAHCMTPWFGLFGSNSGFDSLKECFGNEVEKIYAVESGMSADPGMLWRLKEKVNIVSFSDSHSFWPWRLGREATIFDIPELSYDNLINAIRTGYGLRGTIETPPEYGKYHFDGHRLCGFSSSPAETKKLGGKCPVCGKQLTLGVEYRIEELAKEKEGYKPKNGKMYYKLVPLHELIALCIESKPETKKSWAIYDNLIKLFRNELYILLNVSKEELLKNKVDEKLSELIILNREGKIKVKPGFDGEYGKVLMPEKQKKLF